MYIVKINPEFRLRHKHHPLQPNPTALRPYSGAFIAAPFLHLTAFALRMDSKRFAWVLFLMVVWYITSIAAGVYNKDFLNRYNLPMLLTLCQSFAGVLGGLTALGSLKRIQFFSTWLELRILILLGLVHCVGTVLTNISTAKSTASFTHTIKVRNTDVFPSSSPGEATKLFVPHTTGVRASIRCDHFLLCCWPQTQPFGAHVACCDDVGHRFGMHYRVRFPTCRIYDSLIIKCCILNTKYFLQEGPLYGNFSATSTKSIQVPLSWFKISLKTYFQSIPTTYLRFFLINTQLFAESPLDNQNVFLYISIITCNLIVPSMIYETATSGFAMVAQSLQIGSESLWILIQASVSHYLYNMLSFLLLNEITPVSHSVWGSFKRLFIIYFSVWYFGNAYSIWNTLASLVAVVGVTIYSFSGTSKPKAKKEPPVSGSDEV